MGDVMKKLICVLLAVLLTSVSLPFSPAYAQADPPRRWTVPAGYNAHDYTRCVLYLEQYNYDYGMLNGEVYNEHYDPNDPNTWGNFASWTSVEGVLRVSSVEAYGYGHLYLYDCTALTDLTCLALNRNMTEIDVSGCSSLEGLYVSGAGGINYTERGRINKLEINGCTALDYLLGDKVEIGEINAFGCSSVGSIYISDYENSSSNADWHFNDTVVQKLNTAGCTGLEWLNCCGNELTELNAAGCTALSLLKCRSNELTALDISGCTALEHLDCGWNALTDLNVSNAHELSYLDCGWNDLTELDVSGCTELSELLCDHCRLTSLNVSGCPALTYIDCTHNDITELDVSNNPALVYLYCEQNELSEMDVSNNPALRKLNCGYNHRISELDLSNNHALTYLNFCDDRGLEPDLSNCPDLTELYCDSTSLTALDLSNNPLLTRLYCEFNNYLTELDLSGNPLLAFDHIIAEGSGYIGYNGYYNGDGSFQGRISAFVPYGESPDSFYGFFDENGVLLSEGESHGGWFCYYFDGLCTGTVIARFEGWNEPDAPSGDVNGDGNVDITDALLVLRYALGLMPELPVMEAADVNGSGTVDMTDALIILRVSLGMMEL